MQHNNVVTITRQGDPEPVIVLLQSDGDDLSAEIPPLLRLVLVLDTVLGPPCLGELFVSVKGDLHDVDLAVLAGAGLLGVEASFLLVVHLTLDHLPLTVREPPLNEHRGGRRRACGGHEAVEVSVRPVGGPGGGRHPLVVVAVLVLGPALLNILFQMTVKIISSSTSGDDKFEFLFCQTGRWSSWKGLALPLLTAILS